MIKLTLNVITIFVLWWAIWPLGLVCTVCCAYSIYDDHKKNPKTRERKLLRIRNQLLAELTKCDDELDEL